MWLLPVSCGFDKRKGDRKPEVEEKRSTWKAEEKNTK